MRGTWGRWGGDGAGAPRAGGGAVGAQGQQRVWDVLVRAYFALSPTLPSARQSISCKQGIPGHQSGFVFQTQVECQTSVVPWLFPGSQAPFPHSPQSFALPSPVTLYLLPLLTACFHNSDLLRCSIFFLPPSLHVSSLILSSPVFLSPGCIQSVSTEKVVPELFILFSVSQCKQF